jgi:serine phosphatase RsbU (regulator of sigma subunit)/ligand-binding sensor domain-containing protein
MRKYLFLLFLLPLFSNCFPQSVTHKIVYYSARDYGKGRNAQNLFCVQDRNGVLYFGNGGGLLQYDGVSWSFIPVKNQSVWIHSLAVSDENIIYVGAQGEFGYLAPDKSRKLSYVSLSDKLPENQKTFQIIYRIWAWKEKVAFQSDEATFLYSNGELTRIIPETSFHLSFLINNELYVRQRGIGIMKLVGDSLQLVDGSEYLKDFSIFSMLESSDTGKFIVITQEDGFWSVDKKTFKGSVIRTEDSTTFNRSGIYGAVRLKDGNIALNTSFGGIFITDEKFRILSVINKENGLKVNATRSLIQDYQGNIWACLDNGIAQVLYSSPVSVFGKEAGISGNIGAITRYNGNLFVGTTEGLFVQNNDPKITSSAFIPFGGLATDIKKLCLVEGRLVVGTRDKLLEIKNNKIQEIDNVEINTLYYSEKLKILFVSGKKSLIMYGFSGTWKKLKELPEITEEVVGFEETADTDNVTIWLGTSLNGVVRLQFTNPPECKIDKYDSFDGLLDYEWVYPFKINDKVVFSQRNGLWSFMDEKTIREQLPDSSLKNKPPEFYRGFFDFFSIDTTKERISRPFYEIEDSRDRIYVYLDGDLGYYDKTNSYAFVDQPFCLEDVGKINIIFREGNGICWIGGNDGLLMFDENHFKDYYVDFNALITGVSAGRKDSLIYQGYFENITGKQDTDIPEHKFEIKHSLNEMTFTFAAPFFEGQQKMLYSYRLLGQDSTYSSWSSNNRIVFGNLWERDYILKARAMNAYGHISSETGFRFRILSPWYRKTWAIIVYVLLAVALIYALIRIYARHLIEKNKKLEAIIRERTREIHDKNVELQTQKEEILDSINYAQRIQNAVLPADEQVQASIGDHFVIFRPKDIVSGDFYWTSVYKEYVVFCVADCTGHGVPGAFMSMLCISLLNEIVLKEKVFHPEIILGKARNMIIESLNQKGERGEQKDGMDISICVYNKETSVLVHAGANNPLYVIRKKGMEPVPSDRQFENEDHILFEIKADRMPISIFDNMDPFARHEFKVQKNDRLYLFSDGICDQFGGPDCKKFSSRSVANTLLETLTAEIKDQKQLVENRIDKWQACIDPKTGHTYTQIDDICLMGIMI